MKHIISCLFILVLVTSCGVEPNLNQSTPTVDASVSSESGDSNDSSSHSPSGSTGLAGSTASTSASSIASTSSASNSSASSGASSKISSSESLDLLKWFGKEETAIQIGENGAVYEIIPIQVYDDKTRRVGSYIYIDLFSLLDYLESNPQRDYFLLSDFEGHMVIPFHYFRAEFFEPNGMAIVETKAEEQIRAYIINTEGKTITDPQKNYDYIEKHSDYYFCYFCESEDDLQSIDILDNDAGLVKTLEKTGFASRNDDNFDYVSFPYTEKYFNLKTLDYVSALPADNQRAMYSKMTALGDGYYAVADLSIYDKAIQDIWEMLPESTYKQAIYKDGNLLSGYDFFIINHVKDAVFYVYDGEDYYFYDAERSGRIFKSFTNRCIGNYRFTYRPGLLIGKNIYGETVYLTEENVTKNHPVFHLDDTVSYYNLNHSFGSSIKLFPQIMTGHPQVDEKINRDILKIVEPFPTGIIDKQIILNIENHILEISHIGHLLSLSESIIYNNLPDSNNSSYRTYYHYYDLRTGEKLTLDDWFQNKDVAIAVLIANASQKYQEMHPEETIPENQDDFFGVDIWDKKIYLDVSGFYIVIQNLSNKRNFEFTASDEDLKLILKPEIYQLFHAEQ